MARRHGRHIPEAAGWALMLSLAGCQRPSGEPQLSTPAVASDRTWGDLRPVVSVRELMRFTIDPLADNIFFAVGTTATSAGTREVVPRTEEDWEKVRIGAVSLAETANLLKIRRPFTPAGDENNSSGPGAVELSPAQITAKVERDPVEWNARVEALRNAALSAMDIANRRDTAQLSEIGESLDQVCEACHRSYWYPGEGDKFYRDLDDRLNKYRQTLGEGRP